MTLREGSPADDFEGPISSAAVVRSEEQPGMDLRDNSGSDISPFCMSDWPSDYYSLERAATAVKTVLF